MPTTDLTAIVAAAKAHLADLCQHCLRPRATDEDWQTIPEGQGEHLCWEPDADCRLDTGADRDTALIAAAAAALETHLRNQLTRDLAATATDLAGPRRPGEDQTAYTARLLRAETCTQVAQAISAPATPIRDSSD